VRVAADDRAAADPGRRRRVPAQRDVAEPAARGCMGFLVGYGRSFGVALAVSLAVTIAVRTIARRVGWVAKPRADRWHRKPTALFGGVGMFAGFLAAYLIDRPSSLDGDALLV